MSASALRRAAELMRERAEAATPGGPRWETAPHAAPHLRFIFPADSDSSITAAPVDDAEHIASWHPAVALAVADLLDLAATHQVAFTPVVRPHLLAVAHAYLGEPNE